MGRVDMQRTIRQVGDLSAGASRGLGPSAMARAWPPIVCAMPCVSRLHAHPAAVVEARA